MILLICGIKTKIKFIDTENRLTVASGEVGKKAK